jgi:3-oxo-5-alpha-steroid 4-dehydrogenase 1
MLAMLTSIYGIYSEAELLAMGSLLMVLTGIAAGLPLALGIQAPYGRYVNNGGHMWTLSLPLVPATLAWILQECPSFIVSAAVAYAGPSPRLHSSSSIGGGGKFSLTSGTILLSLYLCHYFYRAFIFPFRIRGGKPTPAGIMMMAFAFCLFNGWLQSRWLAAHADFTADINMIFSSRVVTGILLWAIGLAINLDADATLRSLRGPGETGYKIPRGGAFALVSGANFFGEIIEWTGFAIAASAAAPLPAGFASGIPWLAAIARTPILSSLLNPPTAFAIFTLCNIGPRGAQHHANYKKMFGETYPSNRCAVIPFIW